MAEREVLFVYAPDNNAANVKIVLGEMELKGVTAFSFNMSIKEGVTTTITAQTPKSTNKVAIRAKLGSDVVWKMAHPITGKSQYINKIVFMDGTVFFA